MLELTDVSRAAGGEAVLAGVSLQIAAGRPTAIAGLSATGRDALARLLSGADKPQAGAVRLNGAETFRARNDKGRIVRVPAGGLPASGQKVGKLVTREAAERAGLARLLEAKVSALGAEQRVRLAIAQAMAARPALLIIEAPASHVSGEAREQLVADLPAMTASAGVVVVLASAADESLGLGGDIVVLERGQVAQAGAVDAVSAQPASLACAEATSWPVLNTLPMTVRDGRCLLGDGSRLQLPAETPAPQSGACTLAFHPEDATLERASPGCIRFIVRAAGEPAAVNGRFVRVGFAGSSWMCPAPAVAPHAGALMNAFVDKTRLRTFDGEGRALG